MYFGNLLVSIGRNNSIVTVFNNNDLTTSALVMYMPDVYDTLCAIVMDVIYRPCVIAIVMCHIYSHG